MKERRKRDPRKGKKGEEVKGGEARGTKDRDKKREKAHFPIIASP